MDNELRGELARAAFGVLDHLTTMHHLAYTAVIGSDNPAGKILADHFRGEACTMAGKTARKFVNSLADLDDALRTRGARDSLVLLYDTPVYTADQTANSYCEALYKLGLSAYVCLAARATGSTRPLGICRDLDTTMIVHRWVDIAFDLRETQPEYDAEELGCLLERELALLRSQSATSASSGEENKSGPTPKPETMAVIKSINQGLTTDQVCERHDISADNARQIRSKYKHMIKPPTDET